MQVNLSEDLSAAPASADVHQRVGVLTRRLHDALKELGYDRNIEDSLGSLPDARARLSFIARLTGDAAEKVLNTVDAAQAQQHALALQATSIGDCLRQEQGNLPSRSDLLAFAEQVKSNADCTASQLSDIMLAQDFHDLTAQTVRKVVDIAANLEESLLKLLVETTPPGQRPPAAAGFLDGPVADPAGRGDVVSTQAQVDELLDSLGF